MWLATLMTVATMAEDHRRLATSRTPPAARDHHKVDEVTRTGFDCLVGRVFELGFTYTDDVVGARAPLKQAVDHFCAATQLTGAAMESLSYDLALDPGALAERTTRMVKGHAEADMYTAALKHAESTDVTSWR